jgi:hypothetical protein
MASNDDYRYRLWYVPEYPIEGLDWRRNNDKALHDFIDTITKHIERFGVQNPIGVHIRPTGVDVRPGKCRVTAAQRLGLVSLAAIVADYTRIDRPWQEIACDAAEVQKFLTRDCVAEVSRRFFSIKKRDIVHRPGVENEFERDLRLSTPRGS